MFSRMYLAGLLFLSPLEYHYAATGADRCSIADCLCEVRPDVELTKSLLINKLSFSVYFEEDSDIVSIDQYESLKNFIGKRKSSSITIVGYTDGCGSEAYNHNLASDRIEEILNLFKLNGAKVIIKGEGGADHSPLTRRVDLIAETHSLSSAISSIPADYYLIDASGSMSVEEWKQIIQASLKPGSRVFVSKMYDCVNKQSFSSLKPSGGTEIWFSYWKLLDKMRPGQTLLIVSDFKSNYPLAGYEYDLIKDKVRSKGVKVYVVKPGSY